MHLSFPGRKHAPTFSRRSMKRSRSSFVWFKLQARFTRTLERL